MISADTHSPCQGHVRASNIPQVIPHVTVVACQLIK